MNLKRIAKQLGISHTTVSRALNPAKKHLISPKMRKRILQVAGKAGYVPNRSARGLVSGRTHTIGVILPTMFNSLFFNEQLVRTLDGIYHVLGEDNRYGCELIILPSDKSLDEMNPAQLYSGVDGLLISSQYSHQSLKAPYFPKYLFSNWEKPVVFINLVTNKRVNVNYVCFDNFSAVRKGLTYLIEKGHKRIGFIHAEDHLLDSKERYRGYVQTLKDHRLPVKKSLLARGNYTPASGYEAALTLLNNKEAKPTALFCTNDEMAMGAVRAIKTLGLKCPKDVAVMGFDGLETGLYVEPRLTTVQQPLREISIAGTRLLLDLIEKREKGPIRHAVPVELLVRDSA